MHGLLSSLNLPWNTHTPQPHNKHLSWVNKASQVPWPISNGSTNQRNPLAFSDCPSPCTLLCTLLPPVVGCVRNSINPIATKGGGNWTQQILAPPGCGGYTIYGKSINASFSCPPAALFLMSFFNKFTMPWKISVEDAYPEGQRMMGWTGHKLGTMFLGAPEDKCSCGYFGISAEVVVEAWEMMSEVYCLPPSPQPQF